MPRATVRVQATLALAGGLLLGSCFVMPGSVSLIAPAVAFLAGVALPLRATAIQRLSADHLRARAASLASACDMVLSTMLLPAAGVWRGRHASRRR
jgi:hypothetical protein